MVTMLKNKFSVCNRIKFPTFWYNCYYFTWSDNYSIQLETLLINHPSYLPSLDIIMITLYIQQYSLSELFCYVILSFHFLFCFYLMRQMGAHFVPFVTVWTECCIQEILTHHSLLKLVFLFYLTTLSLIYLFWTDPRSSRMLPSLEW